MKKIFREPLVHFLLIGSAIFAVYGFMSKPTDAEPSTIVVTRAEIAAMTEGFTRTWRRPPTSDELEGLIRDRVQEEVYYREALVLGLDKNDTVIRRRLRQKMEFVSDDLAAETVPTNADLNGYLQAHSDTFAVGQRLTFRHVFLNPEKHGDKLANDAAQLMAQLNQADGKTDVSALGDSFLLEHRFVGESGSEIAKQFGDTFAARLAEIPIGQWLGPIASGFGVHLVVIDERTEGRVPALVDVREAVSREWRNARRMEANEKYYQTLLKRYSVTIELPKVPTDGKKVAKSP